MKFAAALLTSKLAILAALVFAVDRTVSHGVSLPMTIFGWSLFAAAVVGRAVRQYNESPEPGPASRN